MTYEYKAKDAEDSVYSKTVPTDAGDYTVKASVAETESYLARNATADFTIAKKALTVAAASASKAYDGKPLVNDAVTVGGDGFAKGEGATYSVTGSQTEVGSSANAFTYELNGGAKAGNYDIAAVPGTLTVTARDVKIDISKAEVTLDKKSYAYDGKAKKPAVKTVTLDGRTLTAGTDYAVSYKGNVKLGTATAVVTGKGSYTGAAKAEFKIALGTTKAVASGRVKGKAVDLIWDKVEGAKSYQVQWRVRGGKWKSATVKLTSATVEGLKKGGLYDFHVRAVAGKSKGAWSAEYSRWLASQSGVKAASKKAGTVKASWKKTAKANAGYKVVVRYSKGGKAVATQTVAAGKTKATFKGLEPGKKAWVQVCPLRKASGATYSGESAYAKSAVKVTGKRVVLQASALRLASPRL